MKPCRFVKLDTSTTGAVLQAGAGDRLYGISGMTVHFPPYRNLDDGYHAVQNEGCLVFGLGESWVPLKLGGTATRGDRLKSDSDGAGVTTTTDQDEIGAIALNSGVSGQIIPVQVIAPNRMS